MREFSYFTSTQKKLFSAINPPNNCWVVSYHSKKQLNKSSKTTVAIMRENNKMRVILCLVRNRFYPKRNLTPSCSQRPPLLTTSRPFSASPRPSQWALSKLSWRRSMSLISATASTGSKDEIQIIIMTKLRPLRITILKLKWKAQISCSSPRRLSTSTTILISSRLCNWAIRCSSKSSTTTCFRSVRWLFRTNFVRRCPQSWWC